MAVGDSCGDGDGGNVYSSVGINVDDFPLPVALKNGRYVSSSAYPLTASHSHSNDGNLGMKPAPLSREWAGTYVVN